MQAQVADSIEIARVGAGNLREDLLAFADGSAGRYASPPLFVRSPGGGGMLRRQCTREYKLVPIERELRRRGSAGAVPAPDGWSNGSGSASTSWSG